MLQLDKKVSSLHFYQDKNVALSHFYQDISCFFILYMLSLQYKINVLCKEMLYRN